MADAEFQSILSAIKKEIAWTMSKQIEACRTTFATHAANEVLGAKFDGYSPNIAGDDTDEEKQYIRRSENGPWGGTYGVADERSYEVTVDWNDLSMNIESTVQGNPRYSRSDGWDSGNITDILEGGSGYHWKHSEMYKHQPVPRPWMEQAGDDFVDNLLGPMIDIALTNLLGG